jgi:hypothetical protein
MARKPLVGIGRPIRRRRHGTGIEPLPYPRQPPLAHDLPQCAAEQTVMLVDPAGDEEW